MPPFHGQKVHPSVDEGKLSKTSFNAVNFLPVGPAANNPGNDESSLEREGTDEGGKSPVHEIPAENVDWFESGWARTGSGSHLPPQLRITRNEQDQKQQMSSAVLALARNQGMTARLSGLCTTACNAIFDRLEDFLELTEVHLSLTLTSCSSVHCHTCVMFLLYDAAKTAFKKPLDKHTAVSRSAQKRARSGV
jgi:hypothetical protein